MGEGERVEHEVGKAGVLSPLSDLGRGCRLLCEVGQTAGGGGQRMPEGKRRKEHH